MAKLGITEANYVSLPNDMEERQTYISTLPSQFPWGAENAECWNVNIYKRQASCRAEFTIDDPKGSAEYRIGTDLPFDDIPELKQIPKTILEHILTEIRRDLANIEKTYEGETPEKKQWRLWDPDLVRARNDAGELAVEIHRRKGK